MKRSGLILAFLTLFCIADTTVWSQQVMVILYQPPPNQLRVSDLWRADLINTSQETLDVYLQGIATESNDGQIVDAESRVFKLGPGRQSIKGAALEPVKVNESHPRYEKIVRTTVTVPSGEYEICVFVRSAETGAELGSDCISHTVERLSPPILVMPTDESTVQETLPLFTWTPPVPLPRGGAGVTYNLRIAEILGRQSAYDALRSNPAVFEKSGIRTSTYQYPTSARSLKDNRRYAWRVTAYDANNVELGESEVWEFTKKPQLAVVAEQLTPELQIVKIAYRADRVFGGKGHSGALVKNSGGGGGGAGFVGTITSGAAAAFDGQAWTWGNNEYSQLGTGAVPSTARSTPKIVDGLDHVRDMALGGEHGLAVEPSGNVAAWGNNDFGQLGLSNSDSKTTPQWIPAFAGVRDVAAGNYHSVALKGDGTVWTWGYNRSGELGLGDKSDRDKPIKTNLSDVTMVAAGAGHSLALKEDGTVWGWGTNRNGQVDPSVDGQPMVLSPKKVDGLSNVKAIAAGSNFSLALLEDGTLRAWGGNNSGQLGNGDADPDAKLVQQFLKGIKVSGVGGAGGGTKARAFKALEGTGTESSPTRTIDLKKGLEIGYVVVNVTGIVTVSSLNNVSMIDAGAAHSIALRSDSTVWTWGNNHWGMLGTGDREFHTGPTRVTGLDGIVWVAAGGTHSFGTEKGGVVNAWGNNVHKQLGMGSVPETVDPSGAGYATSPVSVPKP